MKKFYFMMMLLLTSLIFAEVIEVGSGSNKIKLIESSSEQTVIDYHVTNFNRSAIKIDGESFDQLSFDLGGVTFEEGAPELPKSAESIIIDGNVAVNAVVLESQYVDIAMNVAPSRGLISRETNPETVPYEFGATYNENTFYPNQIASVGTPYIMRDYRGTVVTVNPFQYNPATKTLRVYTYLRVAVQNSGISTENVLTRENKNNEYFATLYNGHFLNYEQLRYDTVGETGRMIVITADQFADAVQPYVDWKNQKGIQTDLYLKSEVGNTANDIKAFIQNEYDQNDGLTFVQLVGDSQHLPTFTSGGGGSDPKYALLDGGDGYPEIFIGRFSVESDSDINTQVQRTIYYERDIDAESGDWMQKGFGVASSEGAGQGDDGEADYQHQDVIRQKLLDYGYLEVDQIYATNGGNSQTVATALNEGRGIANYTGHGSTTTWVTTGFSNNDINALTNDNMLPFINTVACVNGNFTGATCFAEAWMRATNNTTGQPTGAIAIYASTINQSWAPPMHAQDHLIDLLVEEEKNTTGGLFYNSSCEMLDEYGADDMYETWHIFGDASLQVRTKAATAFAINDLSPIFLGFTEYSVNTGVAGSLVSLTDGDDINISAFADASGVATLTFDAFTNPVDLTLTVSAYNKTTFIETINVLPAGGAYITVLNPTFNTETTNGADVELAMTFSNVGDEGSDALEAVMTTSDDYINITDADVVIGEIDASNTETPTDTFGFTISNTVPNNYLIPITIEVTDGTNIWETMLNVTAKAPELSITSLVVDNDLGMLSAGETVDVTATIENIGQAQIADVNFQLFTQSEDLITINENTENIATLAAGNTAEASFSITVATDAEEGTLVNFLLLANAGGYSAATTKPLSIGQVIEDFESGDLSSFEWSNDGWEIVSDDVHEGSYALKSQDISHGESADISITTTLTADGEISFFRKVSSENSYDYLEFYINGEMQDSWCGDEGWAEETFEVAAGEVEFKWSYAKDGSVDGGEDCAWIDMIHFPAIAANAAGEIVTNTTAIDFGDVDMQNVVEPQNITVFNMTAEAVSGSLILPAEITVNGESGTVSFDIEANSSYTFATVFTPVAEGEYNESIGVSINGGDLISVTVTATVTGTSQDGVPAVTALTGNYPNPFNPETAIQFNLNKNQRVSVEIYNIRGQKVKTLVNKDLQAGKHEYKWYGNNDANQSVSSGVYFYRMKTDRYTSTKKMVLLK